MRTITATKDADGNIEFPEVPWPPEGTSSVSFDGTTFTIHEIGDEEPQPVEEEQQPAPEEQQPDAPV